MGLCLILIATVILAACGSSKKSSSASSSSSGGDSVKVGVLQSLSGTMSISEVAVKNSELLAIDEINKAGGVMGKKISAITEDGESKPEVFAQKVEKLISS